MFYVFLHDEGTDGVAPSTTKIEVAAPPERMYLYGLANPPCLPSACPVEFFNFRFFGLSAKLSPSR